MSQLLASGGQSIGVSGSTSVLPKKTQDWSPLGWTGWISLQSKVLSRVFSNTHRNMQSTSCETLSWLNHKLELQTGRNISNLRYADDTTLTAESKEELNNLLMKVKRGELKSWLKIHHSKNEDHGIQSHHFMAYRWGNNGNSDRLFSWAPKSLQIVTAAMKLKAACSLEEKLWPY